MARYWTIIGYDQETKETLGVIAKFEASDLTAAKEVLIKDYPQHFYGANVIEVNEDGSQLEGGDFACIAVKSYYEYYGRLPV